MSGKSTLVADAALDKLAEIRQFVESSARAHGMDNILVSDLVLAVDEAATNIIVHGYKHHTGTIKVDVEVNSTAAIVRLRDRAPAFDPCSHLNMDLKAALEKDTPGGIGLHLINRSVDDISYRVPEDGGNELTLVKQTT
jgi:serine/threonine-protein kinase RsbW